jgi:hypothetical protein
MIGVLSIDPGTTRYAIPLGGVTFATESAALTPVPPGTGLIARDFAASVQTAPGAGQSITIAFRLNQADTGLSCTIANAATSCAAAGATADLPAGARMSMRSTASASATANNVSWGFRVVF